MSDSSENKTIAKLEANYLINNRRYVYTALEDAEDVDWHWSLEEVSVFQELWKSEISMKDIAAYMKRSELSILIIALDRLAKGKIKPRKGWQIW